MRVDPEGAVASKEMSTAFVVVAAIALGAFNGFLLAQMMFGGTSVPAKLVTAWAEWAARRWPR